MIARKFPPRKCTLCGKTFIPTSGRQKICKDTHYYKCEICGTMFEYAMKDIHNHVTTCCKQCTDEKVRRNYIAKYGTSHPMQNIDIKNKFRASRLGIQEFNYKYIPPVSKYAHELCDYLSVLGVSSCVSQVINKFRYDVWIPEYKIAISLDNTETHNSSTTEIDKYYHKDLTTNCQLGGARCIHIYDWDDPEKVIESILPTSSIHARNCEIYRLTKECGDEFLDRYHIQNSCRGQLLYLGLVYEDEVVQVMTFGKSRYNANYDVEMLRLCSKSGLRINGGASKLFSYAINEYALSNIITYCDLSKFEGNVYSKIGMELSHLVRPQRIWSKGDEMVTSNLLLSTSLNHLIKDDMHQIFDEDLMVDHGWLPVYNCGRAVYTYNR